MNDELPIISEIIFPFVKQGLQAVITFFRTHIGVNFIGCKLASPALSIPGETDTGEKPDQILFELVWALAWLESIEFEYPIRALRCFNLVRRVCGVIIFEHENKHMSVIYKMDQE
jgi:hypothetical protein